jgi:hypothetical protein
MNGEASSFIAYEDQIFVGKLKDSFQINKAKRKVILKFIPILHVEALANKIKL